MEEKLKGKLYKEVLIVIGLLLTIEIILGIFFTEKFGFVMSKMLYLIGDCFGWWINLLAVFFRHFGDGSHHLQMGDVKIGGIDAKPDFTTWQWYSISICGGIGCGLLLLGHGRTALSFHAAAVPSTPCRKAGTRRFCCQSGHVSLVLCPVLHLFHSGLRFCTPLL